MVDQLAAQALQVAQADLRGAAFVVIQQNGDSHKSAVYAASEAAITLGARPGMPVFVMRRRVGRRVRILCRDEVAETDSRQSLERALQRWTPAFELSRRRGKLSATLDLAGTPASRLWSAREVGEQLQRHVRRVCGLTAAIGVAGGRLAARLVVGKEGFDGVGVCAPQDEAALLRRTTTDDLPGLGTRCRERAARYGVDCVDQLLQLNRSSLVQRFGRDDGLRLYGLVRGLDNGPRLRCAEIFEVQTVLAEDVNDDVALRQALHLTVDKMCHALRCARQVATGLTLRLTYTDSRRRHKSRLLAASSDDYVKLCAAADGLFKVLHNRRVAIKAFTVICQRTTPATGQGDLFAGVAEARQQRLGRAITDIRLRMGFDAIGTAGDSLPRKGG